MMPESGQPFPMRTSIYEECTEGLKLSVIFLFLKLIGGQMGTSFSFL